MTSVGRKGFSLLEVLVALVLVLLTLTLLARGMTLVSQTVSTGQRRIDLHRGLETARRVLRKDLNAMTGTEWWPLYVGEELDTEPALAFMRYREGTSEDTETEEVQYWLESHPDEARLREWVRYVKPVAAVDRAPWPDGIVFAPPGSDWDREVVLDHVIALDLKVWTAVEEAEAGGAVHGPEAVDVRWAVTRPPFAEVNALADAYLERVRQERGEWIEFRCRPEGTHGL